MGSGTLEKLTIYSYSDANYSQGQKSYTVAINPQSYSASYTVSYNKTQATGTPTVAPRYKYTPPETVSFQLIFDGTGMVSTIPASVLNQYPDVTSQINAFQQLVFDYDGSIHSPRYLKLSWGALLFKGRLTSLSFNYTLFKGDGTPLRAKADCSFVGSITDLTAALQANKSSPDLTHVHVVQAGDTLYNIANTIYGNPSYYIEIAKFNRLDNFRELRPGTRLLIPSIKS